MEPITETETVASLLAVHPFSLAYPNVPRAWRERLTMADLDRVVTVAVHAAYEHRALHRNDTDAPSPVSIAWQTVRRLCPWMRAKDGLCALARNTSHRRSYRAPLGELFGIPDAYEFGSHSAKYPRTQKSIEDEVRVAHLIARHLDGLMLAMDLLKRGIELDDGRWVRVNYIAGQNRLEWWFMEPHPRGGWRFLGRQDEVWYADLLWTAQSDWEAQVAYRWTNLRLKRSW